MNHYEILEVSRNASQEVIKAAYKSLIQRYHPDRNPGDAEIAKRASMVVQAYEVLSDLNERAAYDTQLNQQAAENLIVARDDRRDVIAPSASADKDSRDWFLWIMVALILASGWFVLSPAKKDPSPGIELKAVRNQLDEIVRTHPESSKQEGDGTMDVAARTIPIFITELAVNLRIAEEPSGVAKKAPGDSLETDVEAVKFSGDAATPDVPEISWVDSGHVLSIPALSATVGTFDPDKVIQYIDSHRELIRQKLAEKLVDAKYDELVKIGGDRYLRDLILDSIGETTGTDRHEDYPSSNAQEPARYGVVEVLLPESFSVR